MTTHKVHIIIKEERVVSAMITLGQMKVIDEYVNDEYYDKEKLVKYLNMHTVVGNEIFDYVDRKNSFLYNSKCRE